jgi:hypothetical protein
MLSFDLSTLTMELQLINERRLAIADGSPGIGRAVAAGVAREGGSSSIASRAAAR